MLKTHKLNLAYQGKHVVFDTSINFEAGKITCLIGPNGCGKSTLLRALAGLMPPHSGETRLSDRQLTAWPRKALARRLALLPQNPSAPDGISVQQLVSYGRYPHQGLLGHSSQADRDAIEWALTITAMSEFRHRAFSTLSGGERQRGWIALALAQQSDILLLDEPTTYLDIGHQMDVLHLLTMLNRKHHISIIMVLHDINQASQYADRILAMQAGRIIADGKPLEVISTQLLQALFGVGSELIMRKEGEHTYPYCFPLSPEKNNEDTAPK